MAGDDSDEESDYSDTDFTDGEAGNEPDEPQIGEAGDEPQPVGSGGGGRQGRRGLGRGPPRPGSSAGRSAPKQFSRRRANGKKRLTFLMQKLELIENNIRTKRGGAAAQPVDWASTNPAVGGFAVFVRRDGGDIMAPTHHLVDYLTAPGGLGMILDQIDELNLDLNLSVHKLLTALIKDYLGKRIMVPGQGITGKEHR